MPRRRQRRKIPTPTWGPERGAIGQRLLGRSAQFYGAVGVVLLLVAAVGVIGYAFGSDALADQRRPGSTALRISNDDFSQKFSVKYFTNRLALHVRESGGAGAASDRGQALADVCHELIEETLLLRYGSELVAFPTDTDVDTKIATRLGLPTPAPTPSPDPSASPTVSVSSATATTTTNLDDTFQQEYERSGLTETEYKDMIRAEVLREKVIEKFKAEIPAVAESIHYRQILVARQSEADQLKLDIEAGVDFAALAKEKSLDTTTKENGGDAGFVPRGYLEKSAEDALFPLEVNQLTTYTGDVGCPPAPPTALITATVLVLQVIEKVPDRPIEESQKATIAETSLQTWLKQKRVGGEQQPGFEIENEMDPATGNLDKVAYAVERAYPATP